MTSGIGVTIRCGDLPTGLYDTVRSVMSQSSRPGALIVVTDESTPAVARPWVVAMATREGARYLHAEGTSAARAIAEGLAAADLPYVCALDAGERLAPAALAGMAAVLDAEPGVDLVTTGSLLLGPGDQRTVVPPLPATRAGALAASPGLSGATLLRRRALDAIGAIDEDAGHLHWYELHLRLLLTGHQIRALEEPWLVRSWRRDASYARGWAAGDDAMDHVLARHADAFVANPALVLHGREVELLALATRYRALLARHQHARHEVDRLAEVATGAGSEPLDFGDLRRVAPIARDWGYSRGRPLDRRYIDRFMANHAADIAGDVLEVQEDDYTRVFGGPRVSRADVIDLWPGNPRATLIADLRCAANVPDANYDCIVLTQTAHVVDDITAVIVECARLLRPGGVLLATFPSASRVCVEYGEGGDCWRLTPAGVRRLCESAFAPAAVAVETMGNLLATTAFLNGLAGHELRDDELDVVDPYYPLVVGARAVKAGGRTASVVSLRDNLGAGQRRHEHAVLLYHRVATPDTDVHGLAVAPALFAAHVAHLREHALVLPLQAFVDGWLADRLPPGAVAITFDDGYMDVLDTAAPLLQAAGLPATCFATTERLDAPYIFWWDVLEGAFHGAQGASEPWLELTVPGQAEVWRLDVRTPEARRIAHWRLYETLVELPADQRDAAVDMVRVWAAIDERDVARRMDGAALARWAQMPGFDVGAHSVRHTMLTRQDGETKRAEVEDSKTELERRLGVPVLSFAYPYGADDQASAEVVRAAGFRCAFTCAAPRDIARPANAWRLPRVEMTASLAARYADFLPSTRST